MTPLILSVLGPLTGALIYHWVRGSPAAQSPTPAIAGPTPAVRAPAPALDLGSIILGKAGASVDAVAHQVIDQAVSYGMTALVSLLQAAAARHAATTGAAPAPPK